MDRSSVRLLLPVDQPEHSCTGQAFSSKQRDEPLHPFSSISSLCSLLAFLMRSRRSSLYPFSLAVGQASSPELLLPLPDHQHLTLVCPPEQ